MFMRTLRCFVSQCSRPNNQRIWSGKVKTLCNSFLSVKRGPFVLLWVPTVTTVHTFGWSKERSKEPNFDLMDKFFDDNKFNEIREELMLHKDTESAEVLWRLARAIYKLSQIASNEKERHELVKEGMIYAEKALELGPNISAVQKWYSILLDAKSTIDGIKARITVTEKVKQHMMKAVEINPKDATTLYMLGLWCFEVTVLPWYQRQIASAIFATPPTSSFEEALEFCERAEKISPNFYSLNLLLIGKIYDKMGHREKAIPFVKRAREYPANTEDDRKANKEATEILKGWGIKN